MKDQLIKKIRGRQAHIVVVGLGRIGLPVATIFADAGFHVIGTDVKREVVKAISSGKIRIRELGLDELIRRVVREGRLKATTNTVQAVKAADIAVVCVQTPLTEDKEPDLNALEKTCESIARGLSTGKLVIVESTVPPGTTKNLIAKILEDGSGLKCGEDFWLAYCPERIAPGKTMQEFMENSRVVGGFNIQSAEIAAKLYKTVIKGEILTTDCANTEVAKLAENTFRDVNIGFANELAVICEQIGVDVMEAVRLANTHPRVKIHEPGCGVGGPCIPKDPHLLLYSIRGRDFKSRVISHCRKLNDYMPSHTVDLIIKALEKVGRDIKKSKIAVLGVAYKGDVGDAGNSPAEKIIRELMDLGAKVAVYDPYCDESFGARKARDVLEAVRGAHCIAITTKHNVFEELELEKIKTLMSEKPVIVDGRRVVDPKEAKRRGFTYFGIGYSV